MTFLARKIFKIVFCILLLGLLFFVWAWYQTTPPTAFATDSILEIKSGMSTKEIAYGAQRQGIVRSDLLLRIILTYFYESKSIFAGTYLFENPVDTFSVAKKIASNAIEQNLTRITIPEGSTAEQIVTIAKVALDDFDGEAYLKESAEKEGYLFPETYFVPKDFTENQLLQLQLETFQQNILPLQQEISSSPLSEYEILILASILEREAKDETSMQMVSGILQNRLRIGMPLQADATIAYALDTPLNQLSEGNLASKLRTTQSPYNTYLHKGLPPTPIGNPGLTAIKAALRPTSSDNLFYITATDGTFYYAKTFAEHTRNIANYLR